MLLLLLFLGLLESMFVRMTTFHDNDHDNHRRRRRWSRHHHQTIIRNRFRTVVITTTVVVIFVFDTIDGMLGSKSLQQEPQPQPLTCADIIDI